jgi:hypothetical protein
MSKSKSATALTPTDLVDSTDVPLQRIEYEPAAPIFAQSDPATSVMYVDSGALRFSVVSHRWKRGHDCGCAGRRAVRRSDDGRRRTAREGRMRGNHPEFLGANRRETEHSSQSEALEMRADRRGSDRSGLGLGLSIARKAVRAHGGEIRIRNMPGKGCVFIIEVPLATEESVPEAVV